MEDLKWLYYLYKNIHPKKIFRNQLISRKKIIPNITKASLKIIFIILKSG